MSQITTKTYSGTFLYNKANLEYEKHLFEFIMKAERIDKKSESFEDIRYEIKRRQVTNSIVKVLDSNNVVLLHGTVPLPRAFKVFTAKDVKGGKNQLKVFIDTTDILRMDNGKWKSYNVDILIAYILSAMDQFIYYKDPKRIVMNSDITIKGSRIFAKLFTYIVDYLYKISTMTGVKDKCIYMAALYYQVNILGRDMNSSRINARKAAQFSEREEEIILLQIDEDSAFINIKFFIDEVSKLLKLPKLTIDIFVEKWIYLYGTGTQFALELYPAFSAMITNAYLGCYINNQKTIEKIVGTDLVEYSKAILRIGDGAV